MTDGVCYLICGTRHSAVLVVSVASLRKRWDGPISVVGTDSKGYELACKMQEDSRLGITAIQMSHGDSKRNSGYLNKTRIASVVDYDRTVFIDADTVVVGDFDEMFPRNDEMVLTTWCGWVTSGKMMQGRIKKWSGVEPERVERMLTAPWPALNTGVFGFTKNTEMMDDWHELTSKKVSFMCDEIAAQIMYPDYPVRLTSDSFNFSPFFGQQKDDVRIWHFHGKKHLRSGAINIWWPEYQECLKQNYAGIADWTPAGDRRLASHLSSLGSKS